MTKILSRTAASLAAAFLNCLVSAHAQTPPPPPAFAAPDLGEAGVRALAANCAACHGTGGRPVADSAVNSLAGRPREETIRLLSQFKSGTRPATIMHQIAKGYGDAEVAALADWFSKQPR